MMKQVSIQVYSVMLRDTDGDCEFYVFPTEDAAMQHVYDYVNDNWHYHFDVDDDDPPIEDFSQREAIDRYYEVSEESWGINTYRLKYPVIRIQELVANAMAIQTDG